MRSPRRVALITGGARGIGYGISEALAASSFDFVLCGVRPADQAAANCHKLESRGAQVLYVKADIADSDARRELLSQARARFGRLDVLINNAGVAPRERRDVLDASEESFEWVLRINLQGPYFLTQETANWMIAQKKENPEFEASIVFVTSISATVASTNRGEYCISKAGLAMASSLWAVRLAEFSIPVWEVRPGVIRTDMTSGVQEKYDRLIGDGLTLDRRWGVPEDVGRTVAALVNGHIPYSTGSVVMVDGGLTVPRL